LILVQGHHNVPGTYGCRIDYLLAGDSIEIKNETSRNRLLFGVNSEKDICTFASVQTFVDRGGNFELCDLRIFVEGSL
jgi:hypothetical protein